MNFKIINISCSRQEKSLVGKEEIKRKSILTRPVSHNLNLSTSQVSFKPEICINLPKWFLEHPKETPSFTLLTLLLRLILTQLQDQRSLSSSNLVMSWLIKSTESVKVSMPKNTDFQLIKIKSLIRLKKFKTVSPILSNFGQWVKKV